VCGLAAISAVVVLHRRVVGSERAHVRMGPAKPSHVAAITQPAETMSRIEVKNPPPSPETRSFRLEDPAPGATRSQVPASGPVGFDAIAAALEQTPPAAAKVPPDGDAMSPLDETAAGRLRGSGPEYAELPPAFLTEPARGEQRLFGYRDPAGGEALSGPTRTIDAADPSSRAVPRGTLIYAYLLTTVDTSNPAAVLQFAAARNLVFNHRLRIPFGTRFLGKLSGQPMRDRLNLAVDVMLYPDGRELPVTASAVEADGGGGNLRPGIAALYYPPPTWVQLAPYASEVLTGSLGVLEARARPQVSLGLGGVSVQARSEDDPRAALYQGSAQAIQDFTGARLRELEGRYASYYLVPAGTACCLQLDSDLDLGGGRTSLGRGQPR